MNIYIAFASDDTGTSFTMTFDPALNYIAILVTDVQIPEPEATDFAGLWYYRKGNPGYTPQKGVDYFDGDDGHTPYIQGGYWYINGVNTGIATTGQNGKNTEMSVQAGYVCWRLVGDANWIQLLPVNSLKGADGKGISTIALTSTVGKVKTYTITFTDTTTTTFSVTDGNDGATGKGISGIALTNTVGKVKTYTITFTDATTTTFNVTDGNDGAAGTGGGGGGTIDEIVEVYVDFVDSVPYTYTCPTALRFTTLEYEGAAPTLSVPLNTDMAQYADIIITPNGPGLVLLKGAIASTFSFDVYIDFEIAGAETYKCPYPLKFTSMEHEQVNAPTLSIALNTNTTKYQVQTVTADAPGLVTLKATIL
jgi:hypothetical protein